MRAFLRTIDGALRGEFTRSEELERGRVEVSARRLVLAGVALGLIYGLFMGLYAVLRPGTASFAQLLASTVKVPLLFLLTLLVSFPSLYVFSTLAGSRLGFLSTLRLILVGVVVDLALLASFGPVTGFFTLSTDSYPFLIALNVVFFAIGGIAGLSFTYRALGAVLEGVARDEAERRLEWEDVQPGEAAGGEKPPQGDEPASRDEPAPAAASAVSSRASARTRSRVAPVASASRRARWIFGVWTLIYGVVGAQMGWILRPFIGAPGLEFELFRSRQGNFFQAVLRALDQLF